MLWPMRPNDFPQPLATLMVATCNVLNLANPGRLFYENQDPYSQTEFDRKLTWLGDRFRMLNADVLAVQEVWDDAAFKGALSRSGLRYDFVEVPGAENDATHGGAQGTPRIGIATNLVKAFSAVTKARTEAEFMCFPRVIESPMPKKSTPNRARFIRSTRSWSCSTVAPVSATRSAFTGRPFTSAMSVVTSSKSLPGCIWRKRSAARALGVSRMSTRTIVRPLRPWGTNRPFWVSVYLVKCRGWHSAGLPPQ